MLNQIKTFSIIIAGSYIALLILVNSYCGDKCEERKLWELQNPKPEFDSITQEKKECEIKGGVYTKHKHYADGTFVCTSKEDLVKDCVKNFETLVYSKYANPDTITESAGSTLNDAKDIVIFCENKYNK